MIWTEKSCVLSDSVEKLVMKLKIAASARAPGRGAAAPLSSASPDSGLGGWSCQMSLKTTLWEASVEIPVVLGGFLLLL